MRYSFVLSFALLVAACGNGSSVYIFKPNTTVAQADKDDFDCQIEATRAIESNMQIGTTPVYRTPIQTSCYGYGYSASCTTTGGQVYGGQTYAYDANASLRGEYRARCLVKKGYRAVELPSCPSNKVPLEAAEILAGKQRMPQEGACTVAVTERASNILYVNELKQ